jgi:6-phosphofructokinase 2
MIATVTLNPSLDKSVTVERLLIDEANRWTSFRRDPGGKGINVSRVIHEFGGKTMAFGFIGGIDGEILMGLLREQKVPFDFTCIKEVIRSNFIVTDSNTHHQTRIDAPGPYISRNELEDLKTKITNMEPKPSYIVVAGSVPPGIPTDIYREIIEDAKKQGIKTVLDSDGKWLKTGIVAVPHIIKPNVREAEKLLGLLLNDESAIVRAAQKLVSQGIEIAMISRGREGMIVASKDVVLNVIPPEMKVVSSVGAGDATIAGLVYTLSAGGSLIEAARMAVAAGSATVLTPGTELCHKADVERLLPQINIKKL